MALKRHVCANHSDRDALGVCVMTRLPLCSECATLHEGVLYSRQALEEQRFEREQKKGAQGAWLRWLFATLLLLPMLLGLWFFFKLTFEGVIHFLKYVPSEVAP